MKDYSQILIENANDLMHDLDFDLDGYQALDIAIKEIRNDLLQEQNEIQRERNEILKRALVVTMSDTTPQPLEKIAMELADLKHYIGE